MGFHLGLRYGCDFLLGPVISPLQRGVRLGPYLYRLPSPVLPELPRLVRYATKFRDVSSAIAETAEMADVELDQEKWPDDVPGLK